MGVGLGTGPAFEPPPVSRRVFELPAQAPDERTGCAPSGIGRREHPCGIGSAKGAYHRRGVFDITAADEMFQQWKARIVERNVGRCLGEGSHGRENAGQGRREKDSANGCRHRAET